MLQDRSCLIIKMAHLRGCFTNPQRIGLSIVLRLRQHKIGYTADGDVTGLDVL